MTHSQFEQLSAYDRQHPDARRSMCGSPPLIAARRWRTNFSRSRRPLGGLAGPWWPYFRDEVSGGSRGRHKRPGLDALLKGVARREFDIVAAWSVCRLGHPCQT